MTSKTSREHQVDRSPPGPDAAELVTLLRSRHPLILMSTTEEREAMAIVREATDHLAMHRYRWTVIDGFREDLLADTQAVPDTADPAAALFWASRQMLPSAFVMLDLASHLDDPRALRALRRAIGHCADTDSQLIMIDHAPSLPDVIGAYATPFEVPLPDDAEIESIARQTLRTMHRESPIEIRMTESDYRVVLKNLRGLTRRQVAQVVRDAVRHDDKLLPEDLNRVLASKRRLLQGRGMLEYVESPASLDDVGGLAGLKAWLRLRERAFTPEAEAAGAPPPRGVLLLGVQGAGKSLAAKAIATAWQRPLLRMDPGALYNRFVGETERRLRDALAQAEAMAPVILWIDEIEKAFASAATHSTDGGLSQRMFGTLLTWMQDHRAPVFMVATANNIEALPPELLRKGRFDEVFFVDLPDADARRAILGIHLRRRGHLKDDDHLNHTAGSIDLERLVEATDGYTGAEIEQAIIGAIYASLEAGKALSTEHIEHAIEQSPPLSVMMCEKLDHLRAWARGRCVPAG